MCSEHLIYAPQKIEESFRCKVLLSCLRINTFFQMSVRSNMASSRTLPSSFPESLRRALEIRSSDVLCPVEVMTSLSSLPFFQKTRAPAPPKPTNRFGNLMPAGAGFAHGGAGQPVSQWQPAYNERRGDNSNRHHNDRHHGERHYNDRHHSDRRENDGFQVWSGRRRGPAAPPSRPSSQREESAPTATAPVTAAAAVTVPVAAPVASVTVPAVAAPEPSGPKFSSAAVKAAGETEDRILARVKGKINKIGFSTYEATKTFMQQILDSNETEFLDEFMKFVFQKAATEQAFCPLYAKLLHELADQFMHLRVVMTNLFRDYTAIFVEVEKTPDVGTEDYKAFVEALERKKFRRGYSQFVAELVKLGEADLDAFSELVQQIVAVLEASYNSPEKTLLCEEYIDCLANMCNSAPKILSTASWSDGVKGRLQKLTKIPRSDAPGLTNKGRFALMDLVDFANRGWK